MTDAPASASQGIHDFVLDPPVEGVGPLSVRVVGEDGPIVVLVHGLGRVALAFARVARALGGRCRLVLPDNPGLGRSSHLPVPKTVEETARLHLETLESLKLPPPYHVAGLSLGGMIAPALAGRLGSRCASVTLFSASSRESGFWRLDPFALLRMGGRMLRTFGIDHRVNMPELVRPAVLQNEPDLPLVLDRVQHAEGFSARAGFEQLLAAMKFKIGPHAAKLPERRLVVVGSGDRLVPPSNSRRLSEILRAPLLEIPRAGHDLGVDAPREMASILEAMAQGADPATVRP